MIAMRFVVVFGGSTKEVNMLAMDFTVKVFKDFTTWQRNSPSHAFFPQHCQQEATIKKS
jgi:hypothetical protein